MVSRGLHRLKGMPANRRRLPVSDRPVLRCPALDPQGALKGCARSAQPRLLAVEAGADMRRSEPAAVVLKSRFKRPKP